MVEELLSKEQRSLESRQPVKNQVYVRVVLNLLQPSTKISKKHK